MSGAVELAGMLRDLVDVLLPGDAEWPSGSAAGTHGLLAARLLETKGEPAVEALDRALVECGAPFAALNEPERIAIVERLERDYPALFGQVRTIAYISYYESPVVVRAVRALGQPYDPLSGLNGYPLPPFDLAADRPRHGRGGWIPTDQVRRVDIGGLPHLGGSDDRA